MSSEERVSFYGVDGWNRPVFKSLDRPRHFFGSVEILVKDNATEAEVLAKVSERDLVWFGREFDCEPMGTPPGTIRIIKRT